MKKHSAFSLIELSIVILIIGILVAGIMQGRVMVKKSRRSAAQAITKNSVVNEMSGLALWYETSLESSFKESEMSDGGNVSVWHDNNPQAINRNNADQGTAANQPKFYENVFNGALPALRFDGVDDALTTANGFDSDSENVTIFLVWQSSLDSTWQVIISKGYTPSPYRIAITGYAHYLTYADAMNNGASANSAIITAANSLNIISARRAKNGTTQIWINGSSGGTNTDSSGSNLMTTTESLWIGGYPSKNYAQGDFAEMIIFKRALLTEERQAVESYLSKKYNI